VVVLGTRLPYMGKEEGLLAHLREKLGPGEGGWAKSMDMRASRAREEAPGAASHFPSHSTFVLLRSPFSGPSKHLPPDPSARCGAR